MSSETLDRKQAPGDLPETPVVLRRRGRAPRLPAVQIPAPGRQFPDLGSVFILLSLILVSRGPLLLDASLLQNYKTQAAETGIQEL